jgi:hypothetical protein
MLNIIIILACVGVCLWAACELIHPSRVTNWLDDFRFDDGDDIA